MLQSWRRLGAPPMYLDSFSVLFIKGPNVKSISCIHLPAWWNQGWWILQRHQAWRKKLRQGRRALSVLFPLHSHFLMQTAFVSMLSPSSLTPGHALKPSDAEILLKLSWSGFSQCLEGRPAGNLIEAALSSITEGRKEMRVINK